MKKLPEELFSLYEGKRFRGIEISEIYSSEDGLKAHGYTKEPVLLENPYYSVRVKKNGGRKIYAAAIKERYLQEAAKNGDMTAFSELAFYLTQGDNRLCINSHLVLEAVPCTDGRFLLKTVVPECYLLAEKTGSHFRILRSCFKKRRKKCLKNIA